MRKFLLLSMALVAAPAALHAQSDSDDIQARARVLGTITVTGQSDLDFGDFLAGGQSKTVAPTDANSGEFLVSGDPGAEVQLTFTLPADLTDGGAGTIALSNWAVNVGAARAGSSPLVLAGNTGTAFLSAGVTGQLGVFVGGQAASDAADPSGLYTGTITLDAAYTGF